VTMRTVDLRSDTVTRPTPGMREAMFAAPLGDDVFGDDPSVNALQERIAALLGRASAPPWAGASCARSARCTARPAR